MQYLWIVGATLLLMTLLYTIMIAIGPSIPDDKWVAGGMGIVGALLLFASLAYIYVF